MNFRGAKWLAGMALLSILIAGGVLWHRSRIPATVLPDGSLLRIREITYASELDYLYYRGNWWQRLVSEYVPLNWRLRFGYKSPGSGGFSFGSIGSTNLFVITEQRLNTNNLPIKLERIHVIDRDGSVFEAVSDAVSTGDRSVAIQGWRFKAFPRRHPKIRLKFIYKASAETYETAAEMQIPNPVYDHYPEWQPEAIPAVKQAGDLKVTLRSFVSGINHEIDASPKSRWYWIARRTTRLTFDAEQIGRTNNPWSFRSLLLTDATGNYWKPSFEAAPNAPSSESISAEFIGALWPSEPAWKIRVEFSRTNDFHTHELVTFTEVPVPGTNQIIKPSMTKELHGVPLEIVALGGRGAVLPEEFSSLGDNDCVNLAMHFPEPEPYRVTLVSIIDDKGRSVPFREPYPWFPTNHCFNLDTKADAGSLSITFAVHGSRFLDFLAKPDLARQTNGISQPPQR